MAWLLRRGDVLASIDVADSPLARVRGFAGRADGAIALLLRPSKLTHSFGVPGGLDVAYLDARLVVIESTHLRSFAIALPRRHARAVLVAQSGAFERWQLQVGDVLEISA